MQKKEEEEPKYLAIERERERECDDLGDLGHGGLRASLLFVMLCEVVFAASCCLNSFFS